MEAQGGKVTCTGLQGHAVAEPLLNSVPSCVCVWGGGRLWHQSWGQMGKADGLPGSPLLLGHART